MHSLLKKSSLVAALSLFTFINAFAQNAASQGSSFNDTMQSDNKIYVVMAVCIVILIVMLLYLIRIDIKVSRKEKQQ